MWRVKWLFTGLHKFWRRDDQWSLLWVIKTPPGGNPNVEAQAKEAQILMQEYAIDEVHPTNGEQYASVDWFFYLMNPDSFIPGYGATISCRRPNIRKTGGSMLSRIVISNCMRRG